jgi:hypothetical protein
MKWIHLLALLLGFAAISFLSHWGLIKVRKRGFSILIALAYAIVLYYFFQLIVFIQDMLEMENLHAYFDHDNILMTMLIFALWGIALINLCIALYRRLKANID